MGHGYEDLGLARWTGVPEKVAERAIESRCSSATTTTTTTLKLDPCLLTMDCSTRVLHCLSQASSRSCAWISNSSASSTLPVARSRSAFCKDQRFVVEGFGGVGKAGVSAMNVVPSGCLCSVVSPRGAQSIEIISARGDAESATLLASSPPTSLPPTRSTS